jgi:protein KRI1
MNKDSDILKINENYAQKFTHMKKREAIEKAKLKYGKNYKYEENEESESEDFSEDSDGEMINEKVMTKFIETYIKLKDDNLSKEFLTNKEPVFNDEDFKNENKKKKDEKILYSVNDALMNYKGQDDIYSINYEPVDNVVEDKEKTEFLKKLGEEDVVDDQMNDGDYIDDGFLKIKPNSSIVIVDDPVETAKKEPEENIENLNLDRVLEKAKIKPKGLNSEMLKKIWGDDKCLDKNEKFLRNYILSEAWLENDENKINRKLLLIDKEDEEKDEEFDEFEQKYNHRFEEEGGANITTYQRNIADSYRIKDDSRSQKRKEREIRKEEESKKIKSELQKAKDIKKEEIKKKFELIEKVAGTEKIKEIVDELEDEFDPEKFDEKMNKIFNQEYYSTKDSGKILKDVIEEKTFDYKTKGDEEEAEDEEALAEVNNEEEYNEYNEYEAGEDEENQWFYCDECKNAIKEGKIKYECETCEDYTLCKDCFKSINHSHKMKKDKVPAGFAPPENWKEIIENMNNGETEENLMCTNCSGEIITSYYFKCSEPGCEKVKICKTCRGVGKSVHEHKLSKFIIEQEEETEKEIDAKSKLNNILDNVYNTGAGDIIAKEIPTKFHYTKVEKDDIGLTDEMLLLLDDKTLNKYFPLRKLAPYREKSNMNDWQKKKAFNELTRELDRKKMELARIDQQHEENIKRTSKMLQNKRKPVKHAKSSIAEAGEDYKKKKRLETYGII